MDLKKLTPLVGLALLAIILYAIDFTELGAVLRNVDPLLLIISAALALASLPVMALRWQVLATAGGMASPYPKLLASVAKGVALGTVTPGKLGELYRAKYLAEHTKASIGAALATVVVDRVLDLAMLVVTGCAAALLLVNLYLLELPILVVIGATCAVLVAGILFIRSASLGKMLLRIARMLTKRSDVHLQVRDFTKTLPLFGWPTLAKAAMLTAAIWCINIMSVFLMARSLSIAVPFWFIALACPLIALCNLLPISVSGFGTTQASMVGIFSLRGIAAEPAIAFSLLYIVIGLWLYAVPGIVLYLFRK